MPLDGLLMDVCSAAVSFDIFPSLAVDQTNPKTNANMGLLNGFPFLSPPPSPLLSPFLCLFFYCVLTGVQDEIGKKTKVDEDTSGLVPYGGDSSDEEEERTRSSKPDHS